MDAPLCYVGMDCGGTKTTVSVFRHDGILLFESKYMKHSQFSRFFNVKEFCEHIHLFLELVRFQMTVNISNPFMFVCLTVAGINTPKMEERINKTYNEMYSHDANLVVFVHDSFGAAYAVFPNEHKCLVLISGTGSGAYLVSENDILARRGGHGHLVDDNGSAYDMSDHALKLLIKYFECLSNFVVVHKIDPNMSLHEYVNKQTGYTYDDLKALLDVMNVVKRIECIDDIYDIYYPYPEPSVVSSFAEVISSAAKASVLICMKLLRQCADHLAALVLAILPIYVKDSSTNKYIHKRCVVNLVCSGSFLNNFSIMKYDFFKKLNEYPNPDSIHLRMICVNDIGSYGASYYGLIKYRKLIRTPSVEHPKVKPRETIEVYSGPLSKSPRFP